MSSFDPKKLVIHTTQSNLVAVENWKPKKAVFVLSRHDTFDSSFPTTYRKLDLVVFIFWSVGPSISALKPRSANMRHLCETIYWNWYGQAPTKAIFVNAGEIHHRQFLDHYGEGFRTRQSYHETEKAFQGIFNDTFGLPGPSSGNRRANSEVDKMPECSFLTMREYLTTRDWSGEFTAKEVRPWLNDGVVGECEECEEEDEDEKEQDKDDTG